MKQLTTLKEWKLLKETISKYKLILEASESAEGEVIKDLTQWKQLMADKYDGIEFVDNNDTIAAYNGSELVGHYDIILNKGIVYDMNLIDK